MENEMKQLLSNLYRFYYALKVRRGYFVLYNRIGSTRSMEKSKNEDAWMRKWRRLDKQVTPKAFRIFSQYIGERIPYMRLLALDIMIDQWGNPKLIEFNNMFFSYWFFQFTNGSAYGDYTDEIIDYCIKRHKEMPMKVLPI